MKALTVGLLALLLLAEPFSREVNYMSAEGYARWVAFQRSGTWAPR